MSLQDQSGWFLTTPSVCPVCIGVLRLEQLWWLERPTAHTCLSAGQLPLCWPRLPYWAHLWYLFSACWGGDLAANLTPPPPFFLLVIAPLEGLCFLLSAVFFNFYMCVWSDGDKLGDLLKGSELSHCARVGGEAFKKGKKEKKRKKVLDYEINLSWNQE